MWIFQRVVGFESAQIDLNVYSEVLYVSFRYKVSRTELGHNNSGDFDERGKILARLNCRSIRMEVAIFVNIPPFIDIRLRLFIMFHNIWTLGSPVDPWILPG